MAGLYVCVHAQLCPTFCNPMPAMLLCPWDFPGKNTGVGCHFLIQGILREIQIKTVYYTVGLQNCLMYFD